jgi:hypothetical protein
MRRTTKTVLLHLFMAGATTGGLVAWRWQRRWGATVAEQRRPLPGDDVVPVPSLHSTRAVGIDAPPGLVWPWVAQIGHDKAGFHACDGFDVPDGRSDGRFRRRSSTTARAVDSEWQEPRVGDSVDLAEDVSLRIALAEPDRALVLERPSGDLGSPAVPPFEFSLAFVLEPEGPTGTRLVVRERYVWLKWRSGVAVRAVSWVSFFVTRRMMLNVRSRAESDWRRRVAAQLDDAVGEVLEPPPAAQTKTRDTAEGSHGA